MVTGLSPGRGAADTKYPASGVAPLAANWQNLLLEHNEIPSQRRSSAGGKLAESHLGVLPLTCTWTSPIITQHVTADVTAVHVRLNGRHLQLVLETSPIITQHVTADVTAVHVRLNGVYL